MASSRMMGMGTPSIHSRIPRPISISHRRQWPSCLTSTTDASGKRLIRSKGPLHGSADDLKLESGPREPRASAQSPYAAAVERADSLLSIGCEHSRLYLRRDARGGAPVPFDALANGWISVSWG